MKETSIKIAKSVLILKLNDSEGSKLLCYYLKYRILMEFLLKRDVRCNNKNNHTFRDTFFHIEIAEGEGV